MELTIENIRKCKQLSKKEQQWIKEHPENTDFGYTGDFTVEERNEEEPMLSPEDLSDIM